jgi:AcrR family transcriptional regulator
MDKQDKLSNEQLILEAAEYEFLTKGYDGARTTSIAEKAGLTHAMLHYYFRTKKHIFERVADKVIAKIEQTIFSVMGNPDIPFLERLRDGISSHFDLIVKNPLLPRFFLNEIIPHPERRAIVRDKLSKKTAELFAKTQAEIDEASARGEIEWADAKMLYVSILSLNMFTAVSYQFAELIMGESKFNKKSYFAKRKAENIEIIMKRIIK